MKLPNYRRLYTNDYAPEQQELIGKLAASLNINVEVLYQALNKKVSLADNIDCLVTTVDVTVDSSGVPTTTTTFSLTDKTRNIIGLQVINAENQTNSNTYPTGGIFITYSQVQTGVQLLHVTGLPASNKFTLKIVAYY